MEIKGSKNRHFVVNLLSGFVVAFILLMAIAILSHSQFKWHLLILLPFATAFGASFIISDLCNIKINDEFIEGPYLKKRKIEVVRIEKADIQKIKLSKIPFLVNSYVYSKDGSKIKLFWPYLSMSQLKQIRQNLEDWLQLNKR